MAKNSLKKLSRKELLEMLIEVTKENELLKEELKTAKEKLENRNITIENAGSIAKAALELNGIFEVAQKAADQYIESIKAMKLDKIQNINDTELIEESSDEASEENIDNKQTNSKPEKSTKQKTTTKKTTARATTKKTTTRKTTAKKTTAEKTTAEKTTAKKTTTKKTNAKKKSEEEINKAEKKDEE